MTTRPTKLPFWATVPPAGFPGAVEPNTAKKEAGFDNDEEPAAGHLNWLLQNKSQWAQWMAQRLDALPYSSFSEVNNVVNLRAACALETTDERETLFVGNGGAVFYTADGKTFIDRSIVLGGDFHAVDCARENGRASTWMLLGDGIRKTVDRGQNFTTPTNPTTVGLANPMVAVKFITATTWLVVDSTGKIARTTDGGTSWTAITNPSIGAGWTSVWGMAVSPTRIVISGLGNAGATAYVITSTDGGVTFSAVTIPAGLSGSLVDHPVATDGTTWVVAGAVGGFWWTDDLVTWTQGTIRGAGDHSIAWDAARDIHFHPAVGWMAISDTRFLYSLDGKSWNFLGTHGLTGNGSAAVFDGGRWLIATASGRVGRGPLVG